MRPFHTLALVLSAPFVLGAALPFDREDLREYILARLSEMAGRELTVSGELSASLSWKPSIRAEGVAFANAEWGEAPHLLELDALEVQLDMRRLLRGRLVLPRLTLIRPKLFLETSPQGEANWIMKGEEETVVESTLPEEEPGRLPRIQHLEVVGGELAFRDAAAENPRWISGRIEHAGGVADAQDLDFAATGTLGDERFSLVLRAASVDALQAGDEPRPFYLLATAGPSRLEVDGTVVAPFDLVGLDLVVEAQGPGFDQLPLLTGLPESPPFDLRTRLLRETGPFRLEALDARIGRSHLTGAVRWAVSGERPRLSGRIHADTLVVDELLALAPEDAPEELAEAVDTPKPGFDLSGLKALDADLDFTAEKLLLRELRLSEVRASFTLEDGHLMLAPISAAAGGGRISTHLELRSDPVQARASLDLDNVDLDRALVDLELDRYSLGTLDGVLEVVLPPSQAASANRIEPERALRRLRIEEGLITYTEPRHRTDLRVALRPGSAEAGPAIRGEGSFRGARVALDVSVDPLPALVAGDAYGIDGSVRVGGTAGDIDLRLLSPPGLGRLRADFDFTGDFTQLAALTGAPIPPLPILHLEGILRRNGAHWALRELQARMGQSDLSGRIAVDTAGRRFEVRADLRSEVLNLPALLPARVEKPDGGGPRLPSVLADVDARLAMEAGRILAGGPTLLDVGVVLHLDEGILRLGPLDLVYLEREAETRLAVDLHSAVDGRERSLAGDLAGRWRGRSIDAGVELDVRVDVNEPQPTGSWQALLAPGETRILLAGDVRDLRSPQDLRLRVSARGPQSEGLSRLIGFDLPHLPPYDLEARLARDGLRFTLQDLHGRLGQSDLSGRIAVDMGVRPPRLDARLASERLDYDDLTAVLAGRPANPGAGRAGGRLFSAEPLGIESLLGSVQGRLRYRARSVKVQELPLDGLLLDARLRERHLRLAPLRFGVAGGSVKLETAVNAAPRPLEAEITGQVARVNLREALEPFAIANDSVGRVAGEIKLWMHGESAAELAASADGGMFLLMTGGAFDMLLVELAGLDAGEALFSLFEADKVPIDCAYLNIQSRDGQARIDSLAVDTADTLYLGAGSIDLGRERAELVIEPRPKDFSLFAFTSPVRIHGPLTGLGVEVMSAPLAARVALAAGLAAVQPLAGLIPLIEPGTGGESRYCSGLMQALEEARE